MDDPELPRPSLAAIISALDATRTQVHVLQAAVVGLAIQADPGVREMAARLVEHAAQHPPPSLIRSKIVEKEHMEQARVLAAGLAALFREEG